MQRVSSTMSQQNGIKGSKEWNHSSSHRDSFDEAEDEVRSCAVAELLRYSHG
jgi:hypothetical protein